MCRLYEARPLIQASLFHDGKDLSRTFYGQHRRAIRGLPDRHAYQPAMGLPQMDARRWRHARNAADAGKNPAKGLLGVHTWVRWREVMNVQYWRSFEDLENFARNPSDPHLQAWKDFNQRVGSDGSVGIWHETYMVNAGQYECVYGNMPLFGLAAATEHVAAVGNRETARLRMGGHSEPAVPSPPQPLE